MNTPTALLMLALAGCVQAPKPMYLWESFPRQQYDSLVREGASSDDQIRALEAHAEKARATGAALPPGFRAHLGMLQLAKGDAAAARQAWLAEKSAFPESAVYMDSLLKRLDAVAAPAGPAASSAQKENPA